MAKENFKVYVTRIIPQPGFDILHENLTNVRINEEDHLLSREELLENVKGLDGLLPLLTEQIDGEVMDAAGKQLKIIANHAVGFDNIDVPAATERGIMVTNTPGVLTDATSDHAWALLFTTARRVVESDKFTRAGKYKGWGPMMYLGGDITGRTLGVVGAGRIGNAVAEKSSGFKMQILYCDEFRNENLENEYGAKKVSFEELLSEADFVSVHVPLLDSTHHLFNDAAFKQMKKTAYLINTSRGPVVDEAALVRALQNGEIAGAGIDVYEDEPKIHPGLTSLDNAVLTPHTASATIETRTKMATMAAQNLVDGLKGKRPANLLNPEVLT
ncbi:MAG: D-glycerate dehydrogenase [Caldithrix sp.]|nr:MAG: D-glycerate dehydrogenase [Caldithrix sp.]TDJ02472.1 MAG: D-glycerate dehydrogenase [Caldithrix sp.]